MAIAVAAAIPMYINEICGILYVTISICVLRSIGPTPLVAI
jgi:hypothetical protein